MPAKEGLITAYVDMFHRCRLLVHSGVVLPVMLNKGVRRERLHPHTDTHPNVRRENRIIVLQSQYKNGDQRRRKPHSCMEGKRHNTKAV